jgi:hypothetical protein
MDSIRFPDQPSDPLESSQGDRTAAAIRDLAYELAGAKDRNLAVDVLVYATGLAEYETSDLRSYAARHGLSPEGFRKQVIALQRRLGLPPRARQVRHDN